MFSGEFSLVKSLWPGGRGAFSTSRHIVPENQLHPRHPSTWPGGRRHHHHHHYDDYSSGNKLLARYSTLWSSTSSPTNLSGRSVIIIQIKTIQIIFFKPIIKIIKKNQNHKNCNILAILIGPYSWNNGLRLGGAPLFCPLWSSSLSTKAQIPHECIFLYCSDKQSASARRLQHKRPSAGNLLWPQGMRIIMVIFIMIIIIIITRPRPAFGRVGLGGSSRV